MTDEQEQENREKYEQLNRTEDGRNKSMDFDSTASDDLAK